MIELFFFHVGNILFGIISILLTARGIKSGYILSVSLFFNILLWTLCRFFVVSIRNSKKYIVTHHYIVKVTLFVIYLSFQMVPMLMWCYIFSTVMTVLIPGTGRFVFNYDINPDIHIGLIMCVSTLIIFNNLYPIWIFKKNLTI